MKSKGSTGWFGHQILDTLELEGGPVKFGSGKFTVSKQDSASHKY